MEMFIPLKNSAFGQDGVTSKLDQPGYINNAASALALFHAPETIPAMRKALGSQAPAIRRATLTSLASSPGKTAIPLLLYNLQSSDKEMQITVVLGLSQITGLEKPEGVGLWRGEESAYIEFWRHWEETHQEEVSRLREDLQADSKR